MSLATGVVIALWCVHVLAKSVLVVERHGLSVLVSPAAVGLYFLRDATVVAGLGALAVVGLLALRGHRIAVGAGWVLSVLAAVYVAVNIGFFREFSTPLNRGLLQQAEGMTDLGDSALGFVTWSNVWPVLASVVVMVGVPLLVRVAALRWVAGSLALASWAGVVAASVGVPNDTPALGLDRSPLWEALKLAVADGEAPSPVVGMDLSAPLPRGSIAEPYSPTPDLSDLRGQADGMNVVLVVLESTSARYIGAYGEENDPMPRVSALADNGLVFDNWYASFPASMKSMFSYLCSTYPYPDATPETMSAPDLPCQSLPEVLRDNGYRAGLVTSARFAFSKKLRLLEDRGFEVLEDADSLPAEGLFRNRWGVQEDAAMAEMGRFLDEQPADQPFFLMYVPIFPHHPYAVPPDEPNRFGDESLFDRYRGALSHTDRIVGELVDRLRSDGRLDNTLFIAMGDHGEPFSQHEGNRMHGNAIYEENVHVPVIVHNPRLFPSERHVGPQVDHTALAPAILDLLGLDAPDRWQGISPLSGQGDMARFVVDSSFLLVGLRDGPYKYIHNLATGHDELYDLAVDPEESESIAGEHPELVAAYREHLTYHYHHQIALFEDYEGYLAGTLSPPSGMPLENVAPVFADMGWGKLRPDLSAALRPLNVNDTVYANGLGTHAPGEVRYRLDGLYQRFTGSVGRDKRGRGGHARVEVHVDGELAWASARLERDMPPEPFTIDLTGAQTLELILLEGDDGQRGDQIDWLDPTLH